MDTKNINCNYKEEFIYLYLSNELNDVKKEKFRIHLIQCEFCNSKIKEINSINDLVVNEYTDIDESIYNSIIQNLPEKKSKNSIWDFWFTRSLPYKKIGFGLALSGLLVLLYFNQVSVNNENLLYKWDDKITDSKISKIQNNVATLYSQINENTDSFSGIVKSIQVETTELRKMINQ